MPSPVMYEAAREAMNAEASPKTAMVSPVPIVSLDPLRSFEREKDLLKTDLNGWKTFLPVDRLKKARQFAAQQGKTSEERHRIFNYIIWVESLPDGDRDVAAVAFNALFPGFKPSKKDE